MPSHQSPEAKYEQCPVIKTLEKIDPRWRMTVIHALRGGDLQFNELRRATGANSRTLSRVLDDLQELGYAEREVEGDSPIAVYYSPTQKGGELLPASDDISEWDEKRISKDGGTES